MKKIIIGATLGLCLVAAVPGRAIAQPVAADQADAAELVEARAIIAVMFPPSERLHMITKLQDQMIAQMGPVLPAAARDDPGLNAIMDDYMKDALVRQRAVMQKRLPEMTEALAVAYSHEFSLAELKQIRAFAQSPAGSHYLVKSTAMVGDPAVAAVNTAMFKDVRAITDTMAPALRDKVIAYLKTHPDIAEKIEAAEKKQH